jgi:rod shape-determining protein MreD
MGGDQMIMNGIVMLVLVFCGVWVQVLFPAFAPIAQAKPPFLLAIVLYYALTRSPTTTLCAGFLAGLAHDVMTDVPLGYSSLVFVVVGILVGRFRNLVLPESRLTAGFFGFVASLVAQLTVYALLLRAGAVWWPAGRLVVRLLAGAALGAVVTPLTFVAARRFDQWVGNSEVREVIDGIEQPIGR